MASDDGTSDDRIQLNVTLRQGTIDELREAFPNSLEDSERVRQAITQAIERSSAAEYRIRQ